MPVNSEWIKGAYSVLSMCETETMHVSQIQHEIEQKQLTSQPPSYPLEVLLTKEAAMGRWFTRPEGAEAGYFSLLKPGVHDPLLQSASSLVDIPIPQADFMTTAEKYKLKYKRLKKTTINLLHLNAALYDEISRVEEKTTRVSKERKELLKRVLSHQNISEPKNVNKKNSHERNIPGNETAVSSKKQKLLTEIKSTKSDGAGSSLLSPIRSLVKSRSKNSRAHNNTVIKVPQIELNSIGRPVLPLQLAAGLTIWSLGEINDRSGYSCPSSIFPVGYCSTRDYSSIKSPTRQCVYTSKVSEGPAGPQFEICPDDEPARIFIDNTPEGCHNKLMQVFRSNTDLELGMSMESDFFGLKHPTVKNLLQSIPGAKKCSSYRWCRFEITKGDEQPDSVPSELDPTCSYSAFVQLLQ